MTNDDSIAKMTEAIAEIEKATTPVIHQVIGVMQRNVDQMSATGKELLTIADGSVDRLAGATSRAVSASANLASTVLGNLNFRGKQDD